MTSALLVDLDGTLVNTHAANVQAYRRALEETSVRYELASLERSVGLLPWREMLATVAPATPDLHAQIAARKREIYREYMDLVNVNEVLLKMIIAMRAVGWKTALVTAASRGSVETLFSAKQFEGLFDVTITSDDVTEQKPSAIPFFEAASRLGVAPKDCVICEDSKVGLAAASAFGCQTWHIRWTSNA